MAALRNGDIGDGSGGGPVGGLYITDGASECQGQAVHFFACMCVRVCMHVQAVCTLAGFSKYESCAECRRFSQMLSFVFS